MSRQLSNPGNIRKSLEFGGNHYLLKQLKMVDVAIYFIAMWVVYTLSLEVHPLFQMPLLIYTLLFGFWLILQPKSNPGRRNYQLLWTALKFDKGVYFSLDKNSFLEE